MKKLNLRKNSGLGLVYDGESMFFPEGKYSKVKEFTFDELKSQLLNDNLNNINLSYTKYYNLDIDKILKKKNIKSNLLLLKPDVAGIEYIKTKAVKCTKYNKVLEVINGGGIVIIQRFLNVNNQETIISTIKATDKIIVPAGYSYTLINNKNSVLICLEFVPEKAKNNIVLDGMKGMSYYVIKKNAKKEIVKNPLYKIVEKYKKVDWKKYYKQYNITPKTPILRQLLRKSEKFGWFFKPVENSNSNPFNF